MNTPKDTTPTILVTGATGFIGSHTVVELLAAGYRVLMLDNLCNSDASVVERIERIAQDRLSAQPQRLSFHQMDVRDTESLKQLFKAEPIDGVIHFAGLKAVGESFSQAWEYWNNNVAGTIALTGAMKDAGVKRLVFSSSATVYGAARLLPVKEDAPTQVTNPYGRTKLVCEQFLTELCHSSEDWQVALLRYFNPVGAHKSALIGEAPRGVPNNLMRLGCVPPCPSLAGTTQPGTALAFGTTSMSVIWPRAMWPPWVPCWAKRRYQAFRS